MDAHPPPAYFDPPQQTPSWYALRRLASALPVWHVLQQLPSAHNISISIGGSNVAAWVGLSPYKDTSPQVMYKKAVGELPDNFDDNEHILYGKHYEARVRAIAKAVLGVNILELGWFRDSVRPHLGVSLDGRAAACSLWFSGDTLPAGLRTQRLDVGHMAWECKCSKMGLKPCPEVAHLLQLHAQMHVCNMEWGLLQYWHRDQTRVWLVRRSDAVIQWLLRRLDLAAQHVQRRVPIAETNLFFPWLLYPGGRHFPGATCADWLRYMWFGYPAAGTRPPPQSPNAPESLTYTDWKHELSVLGLLPGRSEPISEQRMSNTHWQDVVPGGALTDVSPGGLTKDKGMLYLPEKPEIWEVYEHFRFVPHHETDIAELAAVADHDVDDAAWFAQQFPSMKTKAAAALAWPFDDAVPDEDGLPSTRAAFCGRGPENTRMDHLFVTRIELDPARDLGPPALTQLEGAELACFRALVAEEEEKAARKRRAAEQHQEAQRSVKRQMYSAPPSDGERQQLLSRWFGGSSAARKQQ